MARTSCVCVTMFDAASPAGWKKLNETGVGRPFHLDYFLENIDPQPTFDYYYAAFVDSKFCYFPHVSNTNVRNDLTVHENLLITKRAKAKPGNKVKRSAYILVYSGGVLKLYEGPLNENSSARGIILKWKRIAGVKLFALSPYLPEQVSKVILRPPSARSENFISYYGL